jgi:hypothetical protein
LRSQSLTFVRTFTGSIWRLYQILAVSVKQKSYFFK